MFNRIFDLEKIQNTINNFDLKVKKEYENYLINEFGALFTYNSNRIEGVNNTLTLDDTKSIINKTYDFKSIVDNSKKREIKETINHQNAFKYIFEILNTKKDILEIIKQLHQIVGSDIIEGAGNYKTQDNYLINSEGIEIDFTRHKDVSKRMHELEEKYYNSWQELTVFDRAIMLHMAIINIHPFKDGNGRVARLIMNYELMKYNYPPVIINATLKQSYYAMIEEININTDYLNKPFDIGEINVFSNTVQQLSIITFKNMQNYYEKKKS